MEAASAATRASQKTEDCPHKTENGPPANGRRAVTAMGRVRRCGYAAWVSLETVLSSAFWRQSSMISCRVRLPR